MRTNRQEPPRIGDGPMLALPLTPRAAKVVHSYASSRAVSCARHTWRRSGGRGHPVPNFGRRY